MANQLYDIARNKFAKGEFDWEELTLKGLLVRADYTFSASDTILADIPAADRNYGTVVTEGVNAYRDGNTLSTATVETNGACDALDLTFADIPAGQDDVRAIVLFGNDGVADYLIAYLDTATGLPIAPNGGDIIVTWDNGDNKIFRL
jgi:hypothetical protein